MELLKEVVPRLSSVGVILNPANPQPKIELKEVEAAARVLGVQIRPIQISAESSLQNSFESISRDRSVQAVIVLTDALLYNHRKQIASLAAANRVPAMYFFREFVADGGLMSYGPSDTDLFRRAASYVDKVLRGAKPGDLPIEQPTKFELVINQGVARTIERSARDFARPRRRGHRVKRRRVHYGARRRCGLADGGAGAAAANAPDRCSDPGKCRCRGLPKGDAGGIVESGLYRRTKRSIRHPLGGGKARPASQAGDRTRGGKGRCPRRALHTMCARRAASDARYSHCCHCRQPR